MSTSPAVTVSSGTPYAEFLAELDEIQRHKWHISEKEGADVGFERALNDWALSHRSAWRHMRNCLSDASKP